MRPRDPSLPARLCLGLLLGPLAACSGPEREPDPVAGGSGSGATPAAEHLAHVAARWPAAPGEMGLVAVLEEEARIAARYARFARRRPHDIRWMHAQLRHVRHALAPESEEHGPGLGFGAIRAARGVAKHVELAAGSPDAGELARRLAPRVERSAERVAGWADDVMILSANALAEAEDAARVAGWTEAVAARLELVTGTGIPAIRAGLGWILPDRPPPTPKPQEES